MSHNFTSDLSRIKRQLIRLMKRFTALTRGCLQWTCQHISISYCAKMYCYNRLCCTDSQETLYIPCLTWQVKRQYVHKNRQNTGAPNFNCSLWIKVAIVNTFVVMATAIAKKLKAAGCVNWKKLLWKCISYGYELLLIARMTNNVFWMMAFVFHSSQNVD